MKIPTPDEIQQRVNQEDQLKVDAAVPQILTALEAQYRGQDVWLNTYQLSSKGIDMVKAMFQASGWRVRYESDQRDGDSLVFSKL